MILAGAVLLSGHAQEQTRDGQLVPAASVERNGSRGARTAANPAGQPSAPGSAIVRRTRDTPLLDELSKVEHRLELIDDSPAPFWGGSPGGNAPHRELQALTQQAQAVVVGQIVAMHASLSADQTWLESTVDLRVDEVLKATARSTPTAGHVLTLRLYGGKWQHAGKEVIAKRSWAALPNEGGHYLYFLLALDDGSFLSFPETAIFETTRKVLRRLGGEGVDPNTEAMARVTLQTAADIVRAAARVPQIR